MTLINTTKGNGVAIICGSAPCLQEEFEEVRSKRPDAIVIGINEAIWKIYCDILMTYHIELISKFIEKSVNKNIEVHTSKSYPDHVLKYKDVVDCVWKGIKGGASSAIDAVQICLKMKFQEIILVGCPMNGGDGYFHSDKAPENVEGCPRFGNKGNEFLVNKHQRRLIEMAQEIDFNNVFSMSGFTSKILGIPRL